jgi:uncharacterized protein (DUF169 family)
MLQSCRTCGRDLESTARYCDWCGSPLYLTQRSPTDDGDQKLRRQQIEEVMSGSLNLAGLPVGVKLIKRFLEVPDGVEEIDEPRRHCGMILKASKLGDVFFAPLSKHQCKVAPAALGLVRPTPELKKHQLEELFRTRHRFRTEDLLWSYVEDAPKIQNDQAAVLYGPLGSMPIDPDVVVVVCNPVQAMKIIQSYQHVTGHRLKASVGALFSFCIDATATPISKKDLNIAVGCEAARRHEGLRDHELAVGFPYEMANELAEASLTMRRHEKLKEH